MHAREETATPDVAEPGSRVTFNASVPKRLVHLLCAVVFFGASEGQPFGSRHCPHHDAVPMAAADGHRASADSPQQGSAHSPGHGPAATSGSHHPAHGGPCTCLKDCHVGSATVAPIPSAAFQADLPDAPSISERPHRDGSLRGPRHPLFDLHLPNAPPFVV